VTRSRSTAKSPQGRVDVGKRHRGRWQEDVFGVIGGVRGERRSK
jgi:hypothetical protein